ncbi:MAG: hypothetical protein JXA66_06295 [Oligoflexia bacterium]|nr:hypothetical protein [Oligoflexia bacterium]
MSKKTKYLVLSFAVCIAIAGVVFAKSNYCILGFYDVLAMIDDNASPAITIPETGEEYYNKWQCFSAKNIEIEKAEIDYNGKRGVPLIHARSGLNLLQFNVDPVVKWDSEEVIVKWNELINSRSPVCVFAAFLQKDDDGTSVWYINRIKTRLGYWNIADYFRF